MAVLQRVGHEAAGNRAATTAWSVAAAASTDQLPQLLAAIDNASPLGANYLCAAIDAVAERAAAAGHPLPRDALEQYVLDTRHGPRSRRLAYEWLAQIDATAPQRLIAGFLNDPSLELRREAVAGLIDEGNRLIETMKPLQRDEGIALLRRAFDAARDVDQIEKLDQHLTKLDQTIDLARHFGFITTWRLLGPFDNRDKTGFDVVYPPEQTIDFAAHYAGKYRELTWHRYTTADRQGKVDLNEALGKDMGCAAYAAAEFYSPREQAVELRWGSPNATKLWLNQRAVARYPVYHTGTSIDKYQARAMLQPGRNTILLKICQNEQTQSWAQVWEFQLRVCDTIGTAILSTGGGP
ncbi:MAG TPA: hypothetical protein VG713_02400 [Pirellulales bacterium]|nr:hypothetical protein [Pirellulales bacterium]